MLQELQRASAARIQPTGVQQSISPLQVASLLAGARRSLDDDPGLARHYLEQLSAIFDKELDEGTPDRLLLPQRLSNGIIQTKGGLASWQVRRVTDYIDQKLETPLITEELAAVARLSTGHFCRAFKVSLGETPHAYVIRQRLRRAQTLMIHTRDTLSQIACACGLTDQAHLTRLFRRIVGKTPMSWRRDHQCVA
ncbi:helix-turn-helix transcriptional regulator [Novosphingobium sp. NBM11]|uniref:helix-turn-helix domain-containing protein n=1 Tax=Novosphingobium sp. NBM11 TaxID=2596914 RepID=UPI0018926B9D|nr:AraC family transcriptional regulator [Novosphingobium sp. NBM11]MBF5092194.1 helix-turn-helix transcriptional regulator [Novosphingobium sp. NBM11]